MAVIFGPSKSHSSYANYLPAAALGAFVYGGYLYCKSGIGIAWIVAPAATEVSNIAWAGGQYNGTSVGTKCCVSEWPALSTALTNAGLTPSQWFVPNNAQLVSGYNCRSFWDSFNNCYYWSSEELNASAAWRFGFHYGGNGATGKNTSNANYRARAFRCVTY